MQLSILQEEAVENKTYSPPSSQLLKWVGNKQKMASEIAGSFPSHFNRFYEPFLGSGAVIATVAPKSGLGSDIFKPLVEIWQKLQTKPNQLVDWYAERRNRLELYDKEEVYEQVLHSFNTKHNGADFLYLTRSCYGGVVRFRKGDGYMSTPCGAHTPIPVEAFNKRVKEWHSRLKNCSFELLDYKAVFAQAKKGDMIYCDPPYSDSQTILYGAQSFRLVELFEAIERAKSRGVYVALSIDGHKKSGKKEVDLPIPYGLFEEEIMISVGKSMLKRFQMDGKNMKGEHVHDRLLLTYK